MVTFLKKPSHIVICLMFIASGISSQTPVDVRQITTPIQGAIFLSSTIPNSNERTLIWSAIARNYTSNGQYEKALMAISKIKETQEGNAALRLIQEITTSLAKQRHIQEAMSVIKTIESPQEKYLATEPLVITLIELKRFSDAEEALSLISNNFKKARLLSTLSQAYAKVGDFDNAELILASIQTPEEKATAQSYLAIALAKSGSIDKGISLTKQMPKGPITDETWVALSGYVAKTGNFEKALQLTKVISSAPYQGKSLSTIAPYYLNFGRSDDAFAIYNALTSHADLCLSNIAATLAEKGDLERATDLLAQIKSTPDLNALIRIGLVCIDEDKLDKGFQLAELLSKYEDKTDYLKAVSYQVGLSREFHFAVLLVKQIQPEALKIDCFEQYLLAFSSHEPPKKIAKMLNEITVQDEQLRLSSTIISNWITQRKVKESLLLISELPIKENLWIKFANQLGGEAVRKAIDNTSSLALPERLNAMIKLSQICFEIGENPLGYTVLFDVNKVLESSQEIENKAQFVSQISRLFVLYGQPLTGLDMLLGLSKLDRALCLANMPISLFEDNEVQNNIYNTLQGLMQ